MAKPGAKKPRSKQAKVTTTITGRGDYRPTSFTRIRGRGDYFGDLLGGLGQKLGNAAQGAFRDLTGFGDYRSHGPKLNSISQMVTRAADTASQNFGTAGPSENPFVMGAMSVKFSGKAPRIQHREFISDVIVPASGPAFSTTAYNIQPGLSGIGTLFPWGSSVFGNFENYILHGMVLEYSTTSSNFSASSALGTVSMSTVYDAESPILANLKAVNNNEFTTSAPPCSSFYHPIECSPKSGATNVKFVRKSNVSLDTDTRFDDVGIFQISLDGISAPVGTAIGQLWASYDIEVLKAVLPDIHVGTTGSWTFPLSNGSDGAFTTAVPHAANSLPATLVSSNNGNNLAVQMPSGYNGNYLMLVTGVADNGAVLSSDSYIYPQASGTDITPVALFPTDTTATTEFLSMHATSSQPQYAYAFAFSTIAENASENDVQIAWLNGGASKGFRSTLLIVPLDNDVSDTNTFLAQLLRKQPGLARVAALLAQQSQSSSSLPNTLFPSPAKQVTRASAVPASMAVPPRVAQLREGEQGSDNTEDHWVRLPQSSPLLGRSEPTTPPNSAQPSSPAQSIAQAESALAAAVRAAAFRAAATHPYLSTIEH